MHYTAKPPSRMEVRGQKLLYEGLNAHSRRLFPHFPLCYRAQGRFLGTEPSFHVVESGKYSHDRYAILVESTAPPQVPIVRRMGL